MNRPCVVPAVLLLTLAARAASQELPLDSLLNTPVSSASKYAQTSAEAPASVVIVTADDIRLFGYRTVADVLRRVPGFYQSYDRNYTYLGVRGFGRPTDYNNRVMVLVDGHTLNEGLFGTAPIGTELPINPDLIERVEIVQGPGSALYGTGAMLTSINFVTRDGQGLSGGRASVGAGSGGLGEAFLAGGSRLGRRAVVMGSAYMADVNGADLYYPEYDDPATNNGIARGLDWDRYRSAQLRVSVGGLSLSALHATRSKGIPTGAYDVAFNDPRARATDEFSFVELGYRYDFDPSVRLDFRGYGDRYWYSGTYPSDPVFEDLGRIMSLGLETRLRWDASASLRLLVGVEYRRATDAHYRSWDSTVVFFDSDHPYSVLSQYVQAEWQPTTKLTLVAGLRNDEHSFANVSPTPRAAAVWHPRRQSTFKLLYGEAFRAPNPFEAFYDDGVYYKASGGLSPEQISTLEGVWEERLSSDFYTAVSFYRYRMRNLIDPLLDPSDSLLQFRNVSRVRAFGGSATLNARSRSGTAGYASYSYERAEDVETGSGLTNSPRHIVKGGFSRHLGHHLAVSGEARYESRRTTVYGTTTRDYLWTGAHVLLTPGHVAGSHSQRLMHRTEVSLSVTNLLGVRYFTPGGFEHVQPAIEQDGRAYSLRFRVRF